MNTETSNKTVTLTAEVSDALCADILCTALEGGIGYWSVASEIKRTEGEDWHYTSATLEDAEDDEDWKHVIDYAAIRRGIARILDPSFSIGDTIRANVAMAVLCPDRADLDATDADCIVQAACFNELVYG